MSSKLGAWSYELEARTGFEQLAGCEHDDTEVLGEGEVAGNAKVAKTECSGGDEALVQLSQHHVKGTKGNGYPYRSRRHTDAPGESGSVKPDRCGEIVAADCADAAADASVQLRSVGMAAQPNRGPCDADQKITPSVEREVSSGAGVEEGFEAFAGGDEAARAQESMEASDRQRECGTTLAVERAHHLGHGGEPEPNITCARNAG